MSQLKCHYPCLYLILTGFILLLFAIPAFSAQAQIDDREYGLRLLNLKRYKEAEYRFNQALNTNPSDPKSYHFRGMARLYQNNLNGATKDFQQALKLEPADADIMASLGKAYFTAGQTAKAVKVLDQAIKTDPENHKAANQLAWVLAVAPQKQHRNGTRAVALAKRLVTKDENIHTLDTLAAAYAANKEYRKAVSTQEKALAILVNKSRLNEIDPYMERLKVYQQNRPWHDRGPNAIIPPTAKKPESAKTPPAVKKPVTNTPVAEKPIEKPPTAKKPVSKPSIEEKPTTPATKKQTVAKANPLATETQVATIKKKTPALPSSKTAPLGNNQNDHWPPPYYPYAVQIASFPDLKKAYDTANFYRQKGDPAYTAPITLQGSGNWYRVFFGWHTDADSALRQVAVLKERHFRQPAIVKKPYAVLIESTKDMNQLERLEHRLKNMGQLPYRLPDREKKGYWRMLVGAYSGNSIPADFAKKLHQEGFAPVMVIR